MQKINIKVKVQYLNVSRRSVDFPYTRAHSLFAQSKLKCCHFINICDLKVDKHEIFKILFLQKPNPYGLKSL